MKKRVCGVPAGQEALRKGRPSGSVYKKKWIVGLTHEQEHMFSAKAKEQGKSHAEFARSAMRHYI